MVSDILKYSIFELQQSGTKSIKIVISTRKNGADAWENTHYTKTDGNKEQVIEGVYLGNFKPYSENGGGYNNHASQNEPKSAPVINNSDNDQVRF